MKNYMIGFVALLAITMFSGQTIDTAKSGVTFAIGNMKVNTVEGTFKGMKGELFFKETDLKKSSFAVTIDAATVNTGNEKRDAHLLNEDFFNTVKYPTIEFKSTAIVKSKTAGTYIAKGKLTMHGVTKDIQIPFTYTNKTFKGTIKLKRLEYGIGEKTGTAMVSDEVEIAVTCVTE